MKIFTLDLGNLSFGEVNTLNTGIDSHKIHIKGVKIIH